MIPEIKTILEKLILKVSKDHPPFMLLSLEDSNIQQQMMEMLCRKEPTPVLLSHENPQGKSWKQQEGCLYIEKNWNLQEILFFLKSGKKADPVALFSNIYNTIYSHPISMRVLVEHTLKYDAEYRFSLENVGQKWDKQRIIEEIQKHGLDLAFFYIQKGQPEIAREIANLVLYSKENSRLKELYYQVIGRSLQGNPEREENEVLSLEFKDDERPIITVVDDMFYHPTEEYSEFQKLLIACLGNYNLAWVKDGPDALKFLNRWQNQIVLFLLDMNFQDASCFVDSKGNTISKENLQIQPDQGIEFIRTQGKKIADAIQLQGYSKGIVVFSSESKEERLSLYTSTDKVRFLSKKDFFHQVETRNKILQEFGISPTLQSKLQSIAKNQYSTNLGPDVINTIVSKINQKPYFLGRKTDIFLQALLEKFPDSPPVKADIDNLLTNKFIEEFSEDKSYYTWYRELIEKQLALEVCRQEQESWPVLLLKKGEEYFLAVVSHEKIVGKDIDSQNLIFQSPDAPFCLKPYWLNFTKISKDFIEEISIEREKRKVKKLKNLFWNISTLFANNPGESWNVLHNIDKSLEKIIWNPETTLFAHGVNKSLCIEELGHYIYKFRGLNISGFSHPSICASLFYFHEEPSLFYDALKRQSSISVPTLSQYIRIHKCKPFAHEFEGRCFYAIANQFDKILQKTVIELCRKDSRNYPQGSERILAEIQPEDYSLIANVHLGKRNREIDIIISSPYCIFFIEIKSYLFFQPGILEGFDKKLQDIVNQEYQIYDKGKGKDSQRFHCYRILISQVNDLTYSDRLDFNFLHVSLPSIQQWLPLVCRAIVENNFSDRLSNYRNVTDKEGSKRFIKEIFRKSSTRTSIPSHTIPVDQYWIAHDQYREIQISDLVQDLKEAEEWNNSHPLLFPYRLVLLNNLLEEVMPDDYHSIVYVRRLPLLESLEMGIEEWSHWTKFDKLSMIFDFFNRMQVADLNHFKVNDLSQKNLRIIDHRGNAKLYLFLDEYDLQYTWQPVQQSQHLGYQFTKILKLLSISENDFFYYYNQQFQSSYKGKGGKKSR